LMLGPVATLIAGGLTATGMAEESIGYRYFYTLRMLYGAHERPWLPQGQLVGLTHLAIQASLTAAGLPPTQLFPRIDYWAYAASILPILLTVISFVWAARQIRDPLGQSLVALLLVAVIFDPGTTRGYHLVQGDYYIWVHPLALVAIGAFLQVASSGTRLTPLSGVAVGAFAAAAVTIKPTHLIFAVPIALMLLTHSMQQRQWTGASLGMLAALLTTVILAFAIVLLYFLGGADAVTNNLAQLPAYVEAISPSLPFFEWLLVVLGLWRDRNGLLLLVALVPVLVLSALALPNRMVPISLLPGAVVALYLAWRRYYPNTLIETNDYALFASVVWIALVLVPFVRARLDGPSGPIRGPVPTWITPLRLLGLALALLLGARIAVQWSAGIADIRSSFGTSTATARSLESHLDTHPGRVAFLIPDNSRTPLTVDSAIYKGGVDINSYRWGDSPLVASMFPERHYFLGEHNADRDPNIAQFDRIVFVSLPEMGGDGAAAQRLQELYGVSLRDYTCDFRVASIGQEIVSCQLRDGKLGRGMMP
jgi:hypothetical protein